MERHIPELVFEKENKVLIRVIVFSVILLLLLLVIKDINKFKRYNCDKKELELSTNNDKNNNDMSEILENLTVSKKYINITGKYIKIYNTTKKSLPINDILIINNKRKLIKLKKIKINIINTGVEYIYEIPNIENVVKIIIDINKYSKSINNIKTSNINILDFNKKIIWSYDNIINTTNRYVNIDIKSAIIVFNRPNNILCKKTSSQCDQEKSLNINLIENSWI